MAHRHYCVRESSIHNNTAIHDSNDISLLVYTNMVPGLHMEVGGWGMGDGGAHWNREYRIGCRAASLSTLAMCQSSSRMPPVSAELGPHVKYVQETFIFLRTRPLRVGENGEAVSHSDEKRVGAWKTDSI